MGEKGIIIVITVITVIFMGAGAVRAQEMSSQNYRLEGGNFNMTSGNKASKNFKLSDVVGQTAANIFVSKGYIIQTGFLNTAAGAPFSFSVSPTVVDFGILSPNMPIDKELRISIANGNATGYSVKVAQNQPLSTTVAAEIPDTVCDLESTSCGKTAASLWKQTRSYGFGYRMSGKTVSRDFLKDFYYRPFAATRGNEQPALIMESHAKKVVDQSTMTLRLIVGPNQPVGQYRNVITFTAMVGI